MSVNVMTVGQVSEHLKLKTSKVVANWLETAKIPGAQKLGNRWLIPVDSLPAIEKLDQERVKNLQETRRKQMQIAIKARSEKRAAKANLEPTTTTSIRLPVSVELPQSGLEALSAMAKEMHQMRAVLDLNAQLVKENAELRNKCIWLEQLTNACVDLAKASDGCSSQALILQRVQIKKILGWMGLYPVKK